MRKDTISPHGFSWLHEEHDKLMRRIAEIRNWWSELDQFGLPKFGEMGMRVEELRDLLAEHFAEEEKGGELASALAVAPHFSRRAHELEAQHGQILERLNDFINRLTMSEPPFSSWQGACEEFEAIVAELRQHERAEHEIVQSASGNDMGTAD
jgi:hypothetical protein